MMELEKRFTGRLEDLHDEPVAFIRRIPEGYDITIVGPLRIREEVSDEKDLFKVIMTVHQLLVKKL